MSVELRLQNLAVGELNCVPKRYVEVLTPYLGCNISKLEETRGNSSLETSGGAWPC